MFNFSIRKTENFERGLFPTKEAVIQRMINKNDFSTISAARKFSKELVSLWTQYNVYPYSDAAVARKINDLMVFFSVVLRYLVSKLPNAWFTLKKRKLLHGLHSLSAIFCTNKNRRLELEKNSTSYGTKLLQLLLKTKTSTNETVRFDS